MNKILVFRNDRFGEFLLNIPAFRALKNSFPAAQLILAADPYVQELVPAIGCIDGFIAWENRRHSFSEIIGLSVRLRKEKFGVCVILNPSKEFNIAAFLAGIPVRAGYDRKLGFLLNRKIKDEKHLGERHEIEYNLELAACAGAQTGDRSLSLAIDERIADSLLKENMIEGPGNDLVALHPWTSDPVKQWPLVNFLGLAGKILLEPRVKLVIVGSKDESVKAEEFCNELRHGNMLNMTGKTSLTELAALLKKCKLLISGDSGPVHLACAVNTPVLAIFRGDIPGKSAKRWGPHGQGHIVIEKKSLLDITVEEVFTRAKEMLVR